MTTYASDFCLLPGEILAITEAMELYIKTSSGKDSRTQAYRIERAKDILGQISYQKHNICRSDGEMVISLADRHYGAFKEAIDEYIFHLEDLFGTSNGCDMSDDEIYGLREKVYVLSEVNGKYLDGLRMTSCHIPPRNKTDAPHID